jgi:serine/threonine protein kinase
MILDVSRVIVNLHAYGLMHRDIKPANMLYRLEAPGDVLREAAEKSQGAGKKNIDFIHEKWANNKYNNQQMWLVRYSLDISVHALSLFTKCAHTIIRGSMCDMGLSAKLVDTKGTERDEFTQ